MNRIRKGYVKMKQGITEEVAMSLWVGRSDLWTEGFTLIRLRVAIRVADRLWHHWARITSKTPFPRYLLNRLDKMRSEGMPHPLHWELTTIAKDLQKGLKRHHTYARFCFHRARRAIHKVRWGGRRGS